MTGQEFLQILHVAERLKDTPRHCTTSKGRIESVAEHSWRISLMAMLLKHEFPNADIDKVVRMCLIHDIGECFTGDIPTFRKSDLDRDIEHTLLMQWVSSLPQEIADDLSVLYAEMLPFVPPRRTFLRRIPFFLKKRIAKTPGLR